MAGFFPTHRPTAPSTAQRQRQSINVTPLLPQSSIHPFTTDAFPYSSSSSNSLSYVEVLVQMTKSGEKRRPIRVKRKFSVVMPIGLVFCLLNALFLHCRFIRQLETRQTSLVGVQHANSTACSLQEAMKGKERILDILKDAGYLAISRSDLDKLPTWQQVVDLYGESPRIIGLETCREFQATVDPRKAFPAAAGPFNSGTNLLSSLLWRNCAFPKLRRKFDKFGKRWQVNYGKHQPPSTRAYNHVRKSINNTVILPVVAVRDPYSWMQSMCRHGYTANWLHTTKHCPNLIPNEFDFTMLESLQHDDNIITPNMLDDADYTDDDNPEAGFTMNTTVIPVTVEYKSLTTNHTSLAHMWNDWYLDYVQAEFPRIMIRMEDLVFHTRNVTEQICTCAGGRLRNTTFHYIKKSAKEGELHEFQYETTMLDAMIRYGSATHQDRTRGMTRQDMEYAQGVISKDLMNMFGYQYPQIENEGATRTSRGWMSLFWT